MLRNLLRSFERGLKLHATTNTAPWHCSRRLLFSQYENGASPSKSLLNSATLGGNEADNDYVPYRQDLETGTKARVLMETLRERFRFTDDELQRIMSDELVHRTYRSRSLALTLDTLQLEGVSRRSFVEYPWLLSLDDKRLQLKLQLIKSMDIKDINHFVPFLRLTVPRLRKLVSALNSERSTMPQLNRVYYISEKLQVSPDLVTKYLCKRLFILEMPYEMFEKNLQHMIDYNVSPINVLKDLWAFRYTPKSVQLRLERAKRAKKDKIMPWMVRCPEPILQRSLKLSLDELKVLGEFSSVVEYLAHRLGFSASEAKVIMDKHPQVHTVRVTKIKEVLDYLLDEAKFTRFEIAQVPRILCHSLKTTKERMEELKSHGCRPSSLVILCRSRREYDKFLQHWISQKRDPQAASE
ncbi:transcription termination factor, mitochondrial [Drosophila subpulchrella]|uniref:transcription termination factor, mitochondrial n=1 Tax=Drosophila subpulchrella TaxID=1486046 RepID=UPI0018A1A479|nr:transcription termination factor, mitochondrial [Drosophila subpulchrella]